MNTIFKNVGVAGAALLAISCGGDGNGAVDSAINDLGPDVVQTYADIAHASYEDSASTARELETAISALVAAPAVPAHIGAARDAWLAARVPYLQTEVYRFYDGPIDGADGDPEGLINAWPMDENTVDYVDGDVEAGRINDTEFVINAENLLAENGEGGEADVATGYHPIEFLLWGQDLTAPGDDLPGQRSAMDYVLTTPNAARRGDYLTTLIEILVGQLDDLAEEWHEGDAGNYREAFTAEGETAASLEKILIGMTVLSGFETGGERLQAALDAGDQEEEHSCFSDNTHNDMIYDIVGVQNIWEGRYTRTDDTVVSGTGVEALVRAIDTDLADRLDAQIIESLRLANALVPPFDNEIASGNTAGNARVQALIDSLNAQASMLEEVFTLLGFTIPVVE